MIEGTIHLLDVSGGTLLVVFSSLTGTGRHAVSGIEQAEHFITQTLGCPLEPGELARLAGPPPNGIKVRIPTAKYRGYFA